MPHIDVAIAEVSRAIDELGMVGLTMTTSILDRAITDPQFEPIFAELDRRGAILYLHPVGNGACSPLVSEHHITWMVGAPVEDTIAAMQLITESGARHSGDECHGAVRDSRLTRLALALGVPQACPEPGGFADRFLDRPWLPIQFAGRLTVVDWRFGAHEPQ
jgi:hypothetical protein